ncbi:MAG: hypothetical protein [Arizlama microvirus]|nr:MAG: hypothetical protein [Arizlama microvirus]
MSTATFKASSAGAGAGPSRAAPHRARRSHTHINPVTNSSTKQIHNPPLFRGGRGGPE